MYFDKKKIFLIMIFFSINIERQIDRDFKKFYTNSLIYLLISALNIPFIYLSIYHLYNLFIHPSIYRVTPGYSAVRHYPFIALNVQHMFIYYINIQQ